MGTFGKMMHLLIVTSLIAASVAAPSSGYGQGGQSFSSFGGSSGSFGGSFSNVGQPCGDGRVIGANGACVRARVRQNIYLYEAPPRSIIPAPPPVLPEPRIEKNVVFIRTSDFLGRQEPIVIPPTQSQTVVYVLSKNQEQGQQVIEIPDAPQTTPEVYYVNYNEGEDPTLPGGIRLQQALSSASSQSGISIGGFSSGGFVSRGSSEEFGLGGSYSPPSRY